MKLLALPAEARDKAPAKDYIFFKKSNYTLFLITRQPKRNYIHSGAFHKT